MIRHLFKLVWNRKKTNILIMLEVFCSFLVVFVLVATALDLWNLYRRPLGYDYRDVWDIEVARGRASYGDWNKEDAETFRRLLREVEEMPAVLRAATGSNAPYSHSTSVTGWDYEGRKVEAEMIDASASYPEVLGIQLAQGRWFSDEDDVHDWTPVVIDRELARELYGDEDPLGRPINDVEDEDDTERRVVGVIADFRKGGEFDTQGSIYFTPAREYADDGEALSRFLIRLAPGTRADFEEEMTRRLQDSARAWTFTVTSLETKRAGELKTTLVPLLVTGTVGGFLLLMVVLGLTGVMWQNVTRRTKEMVLRRAAGASRARIHRQIVAEVMVTAGFGVVVGVLLAMQVPLLGPGAFVPFEVVLPALAISALFMLVRAAACGLYPGWTATRIHPAEALHYE
jgi:putative ABC transport system permease protein